MTRRLRLLSERGKGGQRYNIMVEVDPTSVRCLRHILLSAVMLVFLSRGAAQLIGTDICGCQPATYTFTLDFSLTCEETSVEGPGINDTACLTDIRGQEEAPPEDLVPVSVQNVQIFELDQNLKVVAQTVRTGTFASGDTFTYTSIISTFGDTLNPVMLPRGLQLVISGVNDKEQSVINTYIIVYTNNCGVFPVLTEGMTAGWTIFSDLGDPPNDVCPIAPTIEPSAGPLTEQPSASPSVILPTTTSPTTSAPTLSPGTPSQAPVTKSPELPNPETPSPSKCIPYPPSYASKGYSGDTSKGGSNSGQYSKGKGGSKGKDGSASKGKGGSSKGSGSTGSKGLMKRSRSNDGKGKGGKGEKHGGASDGSSMGRLSKPSKTSKNGRGRNLNIGNHDLPYCSDSSSYDEPGSASKGDTSKGQSGKAGKGHNDSKAVSGGSASKSSVKGYKEKKVSSTSEGKSTEGKGHSTSKGSTSKGGKAGKGDDLSGKGLMKRSKGSQSKHGSMGRISKRKS